MSFEIVEVKTAAHVETTRSMFREYEKWLGLSLCFQGFEEELANLPGKYATPDGGLWLAVLNDEAVGCVALRKLEDGVGEMKRLYVRESARGQKIGIALLETLLRKADEIGFQKLRLDTYPPKMAKAVGLYETYGFREIAPYYDNPHSDTLFMEKSL